MLKNKENLKRIQFEVEKYCPKELSVYNISHALTYNIACYYYKDFKHLLKYYYRQY